MSRSNKLYLKAVNKFNDGEINRALSLCERSISEDLKNTSSINLKGLLYYLKGDLDNAQALWKMNYQLNKDNVSKRFLEDSSGDEERRTQYMEAVKLIKELKINDAVELLEKCGESDFNYLNVSNCLAFCYIKQGSYDKAIKCIENTLSMDKRNRDAKKYKKLLVDVEVIKNKSGKKLAAAASFLVVLTLVYIGIQYFSLKGVFGHKEALLSNTAAAVDKNSTVQNNKDQSKDKVVKKEEPPKTTAKPADSVSKTPQAEVFPYDEVSSLIDSKNFDGLYEPILKWKDRQLGDNDRAELSKAVALMKDEGIEYFNKTALKYISSKDNSNALIYFTKAYNFSEGTYLYSHLVYMLGYTNESLGQTDKAVSYYKAYDKSNPKGDYEDTVLYELASIYKNTDKNLSKGYAQKLVDNFPNSIYNNSNIKEILSN